MEGQGAQAQKVANSSLVNTPSSSYVIIFRDDSDGNYYGKLPNGTVEPLNSAIGTGDWKFNGNNVLAEKWIGTIDNFDFPIRVNNIEVGRFSANGLKLNSSQPSTIGIFTLQNTAGQISYFIGGGSPETVITGNKGDEYTNLTNGDLYKKTTNAVNTGWVKTGAETLAQTMSLGRNVDATGTINTSAGILAINVNLRQLFKAAGTVSVDWELGTLTQAPAGVLSMNWTTRLLYSSLGLVDPTINYSGRRLLGTASAAAITWFGNTHVRIGSAGTDNGYQLESTGTALIGLSDFDPAGAVFNSGTREIRESFSGLIFASFALGSYFLYDEQVIQQVSIKTGLRQLTDPAGISVMNWDGVNATVEILGTIRTSQPSANGAGNWKLGKIVVAASVLDATQYIEVEVDGTLRKFALIV